MSTRRNPKGRKKAYTNEEIAKTPCARCGYSSSSQQFEICALNRRHVALCAYCDIFLNGVVLNFLGLSDSEKRMRKYRKKMLSG